MTAAPYIQLSGVHKAFGKNQVFADLSLEVRKGETLCLLGGSGTGKSVMLKMLIGLLKPDRGEIIFDGRSIVGMRPSELARVRQRIGMVCPCTGSNRHPSRGSV